MYYILGLGVIYQVLVSTSFAFVDVKNGEMRDYQVRGLNWLITLFESGINGKFTVYYVCTAVYSDNMKTWFNF